MITEEHHFFLSPSWMKTFATDFKYYFYLLLPIYKIGFKSLGI
jgi:hypothetical protein